MNWLIIAFFLLFNFGVSWWNAYAVGTVWAESKVIGGWTRFMSWMGAVQSASGFTWCYLLVATLLIHFVGIPLPAGDDRWMMFKFSDYHVQIALQLGYVIIIPGILFSGLMITIQSWVNAWRQRTLGNIGTAAYNTYAQVHNTYHAIDSWGDAVGSLFEFFTSRSSSSSDDDDNGGGAAALILIVVLVVICLFAGVLTTAAIISRTAARSAI